MTKTKERKLVNRLPVAGSTQRRKTSYICRHAFSFGSAIPVPRPGLAMAAASRCGVTATRARDSRQASTSEAWVQRVGDQQRSPARSARPPRRGWRCSPTRRPAPTRRRRTRPARSRSSSCSSVLPVTRRDPLAPAPQVRSASTPPSSTAGCWDRPEVVVGGQVEFGARRAGGPAVNAAARPARALLLDLGEPGQRGKTGARHGGAFTSSEPTLNTVQVSARATADHRRAAICADLGRRADERRHRVDQVAERPQPHPVPQRRRGGHRHVDRLAPSR